MTYKGRAKSFEPEYIRLQFFTFYISMKSAFLLTPMSLLRIWHHCNLWHHGIKWKRCEASTKTSQVIHHHAKTHITMIRFQISKQSLGSGYYFLQSGLSVRKYTHEQPYNWTAVPNFGKEHGACSQPFAHQRPHIRDWISWLVLHQHKRYN